MAYDGTAVSTAFSITSFPALESCRLDQETALHRIRSTIPVKRSFFLRPKCSGRPKYLPAPPSLSIPRCSLTRCRITCGVLAEKEIEDFDALISCPEDILYWWSMYRSVEQGFPFSSPYKSRPPPLKSPIRNLEAKPCRESPEIRSPSRRLSLSSRRLSPPPLSSPRHFSPSLSPRRVPFSLSRPRLSLLAVSSREWWWWPRAVIDRRACFLLPPTLRSRSRSRLRTISGNVDGKEGNAPETHGTRNGTHGDVGKVDMCVLNPVPKNPGRKWEGAGVSHLIETCRNIQRYTRVAHAGKKIRGSRIFIWFHRLVIIANKTKTSTTNLVHYGSSTCPPFKSTNHSLFLYICPRTITLLPQPKT
ncbi:uncharacterized protein LOC117133046 [Brassica rapa]|uniref:uncharacterized protein LOC117133046 n=1 Tax=Brassica campestris TaxID=3711 RepID=UPI00142DCF4B|nr:uncharacterized protein LOC117133046 [Brassica rapa]